MSTGVAAVDEALGGGLPAGALTELVAPAATGGQLVLARLLETTRAARQRVALIDAMDGFAPEEVAPDVLRHLVWARCRGLADTMAVADVLVRDGNYAVVVIDLRGVERRGLIGWPKTAWHRLHRAAERQPGAVLVLDGCGCVPAVRWRLALGGRIGVAEQERTRAELLAGLMVEVVRGAWRGGEAEAAG